MPRKSQTSKSVREPDRIWPICMNAWFKFFEDKFGSKPTFIGAAAGCYKKIVGIIRQKTIDAGFEWNELTANEIMVSFFEKAYNHNDMRFQNNIRQNFTLPNLLYHIDKITILHGNHSPSNTFQKFARTVHQAQDRISERGPN